MSNFEIVSVFDEEFAEWLQKQGYPHPPIRPGNEMPTTADMKWALDAFDNLVFDHPFGEGELFGTDEETGWNFRIRGFDWDEDNTIPGDHFTVYGAEALLTVLIKLSERCGQLLVYPDSGAPPIILDDTMDADEVLSLYSAANEQRDGWRYFFDRMYAS